MKVSIIIPYFKDEDNINQSVSSALNQTYENIEIIIIDDENTKKSDKLLKKIKTTNNKIKVFKTKKNLGVSAARNLGIKKSKGKLLAFLDSDDYWKKNKLKEQIRVFRRNISIDVCYTNYLGINDKKKIVYKIISPNKISFKELLRQCPICCSSVVIKSEVLKKIKFRKLKTKEDYLLWLEISKKNYNFFGINKYLTNYRIRRNSLSSLYVNKLYSAFVIYNNFLSLNFMVSLFFVFRLYFNAFKKKYM